MNDISIKNQLDPLLKQLSTERSFDIAERISAELAHLLQIKTSERFLVNISRVDAELPRFQLAPGFARQAAAYELPHEDNKPIDLKLFWVKKATKTNLSWIIGLTANFEDAEANDFHNIGIDFVLPETCDSIIVLLSNKFKVRALELKDHITPTQLEIFSLWQKIGELEITDQNELKKTLHSRLWESFNFEPINRKFYLELVEHFSILVHHLEKTLGRRPSVMFTTRLIGRLLFIWFLKKKNLIDKNVEYFSVPDPEDQTEYYKNQLEKLFFEVLNRDELERNNGDKLTPYLNGGLFDKNATDFYDNPKLTFPNGYFNQLFETLNKYNFTVDESSPEFQHVAIDPEMLGRIFESLLAEQIDENTGNSKKKATGAFYTPREIVSYMCEQSLIEYLKTKVPDVPDRDQRLEELIRMPEAIFRDQDQNKRDKWRKNLGKDKILQALDELLVLDPAVGSGAFPMGMLSLLVKVYSRINTLYEKNLEKLKRQILSRSLYGVDIEQTAIEICRLRAWLSIVVDIPEDGKVDPLPNLEFKFVCANTLIPLDNTEQATFFTDYDLKDKLIVIRDEYFKTSSKAKKEKLQKDYLNLTQNTSLFDNKKTQQLKNYRPFDVSSSSEFYDPELMHGVQAFDIVIGNPPYVRVQEIEKDISNVYKNIYRSASGGYDLYMLFTERTSNLISSSGVVNFIMPHKWINSSAGKGLREVVKNKIFKIISFKEYQIFNATTYTSLIWFKDVSHKVKYLGLTHDLTTNTELADFLAAIREADFVLFDNNSLVEGPWSFGKEGVSKILQKLGHQKSTVKSVFEKIFQGLKTGHDDIYILDNYRTLNKNTIIGYSKVLNKEVQIETALTKPLLKGKDIHRYKKLEPNKVIIFPYYRSKKGGDEKILLYSELELSSSFPRGYSYLKLFEKKLRDRERGKFDIDGKWFQFSRNQGILDAEKEKIMLSEISFGSNMTLDKQGIYHVGQYSMIMKKDIKESYKYYLGILNSNLMWFFIKNTGSIMRGGYFAFRPDYLNLFPLPEIRDNKTVETLESLVVQILTIKKQNKDADTKNLESQIDQLVYKLYDLTYDEVLIVDKEFKMTREDYEKFVSDNLGKK